MMLDKYFSSNQLLNAKINLYITQVAYITGGAMNKTLNKRLAL